MTNQTFLFILLVLVSWENYFASGYTAGGLIWRSDLGNFIPIDNVSTYKYEVQDVLKKIRDTENHNFQSKALTLAYYEERNLFTFYDNNTKVTGVCGEVWNMLSEYLNFTMILIRVNVSNFGSRQPDGKWNGLLGMLERNEIQIIPRTAFYSAESALMDYTTPIWENRYRLFIRPEWKSNGAWLFEMFSRKVWCCILVLFLCLSYFGYSAQKLAFKVSGDQDDPHNLHDHLFYTFATLCCQGSIPDSLYHRTAILGLTKKIFAWLLLIVLSSHLISYMTNRKLEPPFRDIETMFNSSNYNIAVFNGSMIYAKFKKMSKRMGLTELYNERIWPVATTERMYQKGCFGKRKYAILESQDRQRAFGRYYCHLVPAGKAYYPSWVTSGILKGYKYKRAFDLGILKLNEFGLTDGMKDRWMESGTESSEPNLYVSINLNQVSALFLILGLGMVSALIIFICENIMSTYQYNRRENVRRKLLI